MKKQNSLPSRNKEWPSAYERRRLLRWTLALGLGLAVVASASISLNADIFMKYLRPSSENGSATEFLADETAEETLPTENAQSPLLKPKTTPVDNGVIPVPWDAIANLNYSNEEPSIESSTKVLDTQVLQRMENETPSQGSDTASEESAVVRSLSLSQRGSIPVPSAPTVGRARPVRPTPTPTITPYPIRSPL
jgi:hypothetical protein